MHLTSWLDPYVRPKRFSKRLFQKRRAKKLAATTGVEQFETRVLLSGTPLELSGGMVADAYIRTGSNDQSEENHGSDTELIVDGSPDSAALLKFDVSAIAPGSTVQSVTLTFHVTDPSAGTWEIYQLLRPWKESEVAFDWPAIGEEWQTNGAQGVTDRGNTVLGTVTATASGLVTIELNTAGIAVVQSWVDNPGNNHGFIIQDYAGSSDALGFASRENGNAATRPVFTVNYLGNGQTTGNQAPVVDAGPDLTINIGEAASLDGTVTDDGLPTIPGVVKTHWAKVSGPGTVTFADDKAIDTTATFSEAGTYILRLRATDGELTTMDIVEITVVDPADNQAPVVDAGPDRVIFNTSNVNLGGSVTDDGIAGSSALTTSWTKVSGPGNVYFADAHALFTPASFSQAGTYVLRLTASDGISSSSDLVTITVYELPADSAPAVSAGEDQSILINQAVTLAGLVIDEAVPNPKAIVSAVWSVVSGPGTVAFANANSAGTTATFSAAGTYVLKLTGSDGTLSADDTVTITVDALPVNQAPVVNAGVDRTILQSNTLHLDATVTDDGVSGPLTTAWTLVSGPGTVTFGTSSTLDATATFSVAGTYVLRLTVNDGQFVRTDDVTVSVLPASGGTPTTVTFQNGFSGYTGTDDTYVRGNNVEDTSGTSNFARVDGSPDEAALLRWALTGIAAGSQVTAASITLNVTDASPHTFEVYAVRRAWNENEATWLQAADGQNWAVPGLGGTSDRDSVVLGTFTSTTLGSKTFQLNAAALAVIQGWINDPSTNFGFAILDYDNAASDAFGFSTSEAATAAQRPKLSLTITPPGQTGGINLQPIANQSMPHTQDSIAIALPTTGATGTPVYAVEFSSTNPAQPLAAGDVVGTISGTTLTINPRAGFSGQIQVKVHVRDNNSDDVESFVLSVTNSAPNIGAIATQTISQDDLVVAPHAIFAPGTTPETAEAAENGAIGGFSVNLPAVDADGDALSYTAEVVGSGALAALDAAHGFQDSAVIAANNYYFNTRGAGEKYLRADDGWYVLLADGGLYKWGGSVAASTIVANVGTAVYNDPKLLTNAHLNVAFKFQNNTLWVDPPRGFAGTFQVRLTATDGITSQSQTFNVNITPGSVQAFQFDDAARWTATATDGTGLTQGDATTITWSIAPDGTDIPGFSGEADAPSNFIAFMDDLYGGGTGPLSSRPWFSVVEQIFSRWSLATGINYVYEPNDDGAAFTGTTGTSPGVLGVRGDVRIGGHLIDDDFGILAYNFFPNVGEMVVDTADIFYEQEGIANNSLGMRNVLSHEAGHGIGLNHVEPVDETKLMEPFVNFAFDGPQFDDIMAANRGYGDNFEQGLGNDSPANATFLGTLAGDQTISIGSGAIDVNVSTSETSFVSIDDDSDIDVYRFTVGQANDFSIILTSIGPTYQQGPQGGTTSSFNAAAQSNLLLELLDSNGTTVLRSVDAAGLGGTETIGINLSQGDYYVRVTGQQNAVQMYQLDIISGEGGETPAGPDVTLSVSGSPFDEDGGTATITANLSQIATAEVRVNLAFSGTATIVDDYTASNTVIIIAAGQTSGSITLSGVSDDLVEGNETVIVDITSVVNGQESGQQQVTAVVKDNDVPPIISVSFVGGINGTGTLRENGGTATLRVSLSNAFLEDVEVGFAFAGQAILDLDYDVSDVVVTIAAGELFGDITLTGIDDDVNEGSESIIARVTSVINAILPAGEQETTTYIIDDDIISQPLPQVTMSIAPVTFSENGGSANVTLNLDRLGLGIIVELAYSGTASYGTDFNAPTFVFIPQSQLSTSFSITGIDDLLIEPNETIIVDIVSLYTAVEAGGVQRVTATITSNDIFPAVTLDPVTTGMAENGGTTTITARLAQAAVQDTFIDLEFGGSATYANVSAGVVDFGRTDYTRTNTTFTTQDVRRIFIAQGQTTGSIVLSAVNDPHVESQETITVAISGTSGAVEVGNQIVTVNIIDDDLPGVPLAVSEQEVGTSGTNNTQATGELIANLGTGNGESTFATVNGTLANAADIDFYLVELSAGDIISANVTGAGTTLTLFDPATTLRIRSSQDLTSIHPASSPLLGGGNAALSYVVDADGVYAISVDASGSGAYQLQLGVFRPVLEQAPPGTTQILYLDFDGGTTDAFGTNATLSPLSAFLTRWGLVAGDENAVIDAIIAEVTRSLSTDIRANGANGDFDLSGVNGEFDIEIRNSRDHADEFGINEFVSRIIIGGTVTELGILTIGIAESIDVGNFDTSETAVVLLDFLSNPAGDPNSLNSIQRDPTATMIQLIGTAVGNIAAHEAGHFFSNWHTDQFNDDPNIMDQGGNLPNTIGLGDDGIYGTADDVDVTFGPDVFVPNEGFFGIEDTRNSIAFSLSTGTGITVDPFEPPEVSLNYNGARINEDGGFATISAILSEAVDEEVVVTIEFAGQATFAEDYFISGPLEIRIAAGDLFGSITLTSTPDDLNEGNETVIVRITGVSGGGAVEADNNQEVSGVILDNDIPGSISGIKFLDQNANGIRDGFGEGFEELELAPIGTVILGANDDLSTGLVSLGFTLEFFGQQYTAFYINNNGNVTFSGPLGDFVPDGFPTGFGNPMIAPFWADVDTRGAGSAQVFFNSGVSERGNRFVQVDWPGVGYYSAHTDKLNFFTLYIEDDPLGDVVVFDYGAMAWTTGDIDGANGFGGEGAQIGFDAGDGVNFLSFGRPNSASDLLDFANKQFVFRLNNQGQVTSEPGLGGVVIYIDLNEDGDLDFDEPQTVTAFDDPNTSIDETGTWRFDGITEGVYIIREVVPPGYYQTAPSAGFHIVNLGIGEDVTGLEFGNAEIVVPEVTLKLSTNAISENGGSATVTATLSSATTENVTVNLLLSGDADQGEDYSITTVSIFIAAGQTTGTATINGVNDFIPESIERLIFNITDSSVDNGTVSPSFKPLTLFIVDDDIPGPATIFIENAEPVEEGDGSDGFDTGAGALPTFYNAGSRPDAVVTGDLNGDGYVDLVVVNRTGNSVSVLLNKGDGTFAAATNWNVGNDPDSAALADFDSDGDLDIAIATDNGVSLLRNNGNGTFGPASGFSAGADPAAITTGDFDGDGDTDVAVANYTVGANTVTVLFNNGAGLFLSSTVVNVGDRPTDIKAADLDNDGDLDLVVANGGASGTTVSVLRNNGAGVFTRTDFAAGIQPKSIVIGDFSGDQVLDIAVANVGFDPNGPGNINTVSVLRGSGNGTFLAPVAYDAGPSIRSIAAADLDVDGDLDIIVANDGMFDNIITILFNNGGTGFGPFEDLSIGNGHIPYGVATADIDNDGDADVISANRFGTAGVDGVAVFRNNAQPRVLTYHVFLTEFSNTTIAVDYTTVGGTATAGVDFIPRSGTLYFAPGQVVQTITVPIIGDTLFEADESVFIVLSNPRNAAITDGLGEGTILNDDLTQPLVSLSASNSTMAENGGTVTLTATLSAPVDHDVIVELEYSGTAIHTTDFIATSVAAPISIDGDFSDWHANPNIQFYSDPFGDEHDTDTTGENNTPLPVDHPDVDLLEFAVTHDDENLYFYFRATGQIGRTQIEDLANGLAAGRYYIIVTIDVDQDDTTGYPLHEGGYYPTTTGYDMNAEVEYFNGAFNTGHYLNHGATNEAELLQAFLDQSQGQYVPGGDIQGPYDPGFVNVLPGSYEYYSQWVYKENDPNNGGQDSVTFVKDRGPVVLGIITGAGSADGHEYEFVAPYKGFLVDALGNPIVDIGKILDLSFSLEASSELAPGGQWGSDTADPINGYVLNASSERPVTTILIPAGQTSASITLTGLGDDEVEGIENFTVEIVNVTGAQEDGSQSVTIAILDAGSTALDAYVAAEDPSFAYSLANTIDGAGYTAYVLDVTSQTWRTPEEVNPHVWKHWVTVVVPDVVTSDTAFLSISGGSTNPSVPTTVDGRLVNFAVESNSISVGLRTVPNQGTEFFDDGVIRFEDEIIAYTFDKFLNGGDSEWPLLLPMVKSAVAAMDASQGFVASLPGSLEIDDFVVAGASKRGWTTWLTAAVDPRVKAIAPLVIDLLDFPEQVPNHLNQYEGVTEQMSGGATIAVHDYTDIGFFQSVMSGEADALLAIVDPISYINRPALQMPKFIVNSAGDEFFYPNSSQFYFHELQGNANYLRYVPNSDHDLNADAFQDVLDFYRALLADAELPEFSWTIENGGNTIRLNTVDAPVAVTLWQATNLVNRDFRLATFGAGYEDSTLNDLGGGEYVATLSPPGSGATAFFIEVEYIVNGTPIKFTTDVSVIPGLSTLMAPSSFAALSVSEPEPTSSPEVQSLSVGPTSYFPIALRNVPLALAANTTSDIPMEQIAVHSDAGTTTTSGKAAKRDSSSNDEADDTLNTTRVESVDDYFASMSTSSALNLLSLDFAH